MELTTEMIYYCEGQPWDDDARQDVYEKILTYKGNHPTNNNWLSRLYINVLRDRMRVHERRKEIEEEAKVTLRGLTGDDDTRDPSEYIEAEDMTSRIKGMSQLLYQTMAHYVNGIPIKDIAERYKTPEATIYKRLQRAKDIIGDNNNGR